MVYAPSDDSFLLAECVGSYSGKSALEIGVGSGIILSALERRFSFVAGTDIDFEALRFCRRKTGSVLVCCDSASAFVPGRRFDLVVSNPPYLPDDPGAPDRTVHGGPAGIEATLRFVESVLPLLADGGTILVVLSSLADSAGLDRLAAENRLAKKVVKEKRVFFETLSVVEIRRA